MKTFGVATMTFTNNWDEAEILRRLADAGDKELFANIRHLLAHLWGFGNF